MTSRTEPKEARRRRTLALTALLCLLAGLASAVEPARIGRPEVELLSSSLESSRLRVSFPTAEGVDDLNGYQTDEIEWRLPGETILREGRETTLPPIARGLLAVPGRRTLRLVVESIRWRVGPLSLTTGGIPLIAQVTVETDGSSVLRTARLQRSGVIARRQRR